MKLPSLKFSLPFIFACWCVAAVMTHGTVMLAYPAMWAVVGMLFYGLHVMIGTPAKLDPETATGPGVAARVDAASETGAAAETGDASPSEKASASA